MSAYGFFVNHNRLGYNLDATSPFFKDINDSVGLNVDQAFYLYRMLIGKDVDNPMAAGIRLKLKRFYHFDVLGGNKKNYGPYTNYMLLQSAMKDHKCVVLHNYASSNSLTVRDRLVEPFMFLGEDTDVRAYEVESGRNKTFKISRIRNGRTPISTAMPLPTCSCTAARCAIMWCCASTCLLATSCKKSIPIPCA